jgi:integral membrane protein
MTDIQRLRIASWVEGATLILLVGIAVPLKHLAGLPIATAIMGPVHGLAFLFYLWTVMTVVSGGGWRGSEIARLVAAAFIPFGALAVQPLLRRRLAA